MAGRAGHDVPLGRLLSAAPGIPTTDMARTIGHYRRLGFTFSAPGTDGPPPAGADFAIGSRDGVELHFARKPDHDPGRTATWVYVRVEDADELSAELDAAGAGQGGGARDTGYRMRELAHIDPDGNLLLFGSPARDDSGPPAAPRSGPQPGQDPPAVPDPGVLAFARALRQGDVPFLREALAADPGLATSLINSRTPLHLYADAPGHRPHPARVVAALAEAGADLDAHATGMRHHETPLHWAASNDDVELIDALLEAGADIEHPGSSISGGPPADSALGYAQWRALRRLQERGAAMNLPRAAALGLLPLLTGLLAAAPPPDGARNGRPRCGMPAAPASSTPPGSWPGTEPTSAGARPGPARHRSTLPGTPASARSSAGSPSSAPRANRLPELAARSGTRHQPGCRGTRARGRAGPFRSA